MAPGCGKTALVEALSKKSNLPIIRIVPSLLLRKWIGDTPLLTKAIFTAAKKLQPCIVFIDEMDSMFRRRTEFDHHHDRNLLTECEQNIDIHLHTNMLSVAHIFSPSFSSFLFSSATHPSNSLSTFPPFPPPPPLPPSSSSFSSPFSHAAVGRSSNPHPRPQRDHHPSPQSADNRGHE